MENFRQKILLLQAALRPAWHRNTKIVKFGTQGNHLDVLSVQEFRKEKRYQEKGMYQVSDMASKHRFVTAVRHSVLEA